MNTIASFVNPPLLSLIQKIAYLHPCPSVAALDALLKLKLSCAKLQVVELTETGISG